MHKFTRLTIKAEILLELFRNELFINNDKLKKKALFVYMLKLQKYIQIDENIENESFGKPESNGRFSFSLVFFD